MFDLVVHIIVKPGILLDKYKFFMGKLIIIEINEYWLTLYHKSR